MKMKGFKTKVMNTYSYSGDKCFWHSYAKNKKEAIKKLQEKGEKANNSNVRLLHKGTY